MGAAGRALKWTAGLACLVASACGPSFQVVYEGDSRFEHCYALDENPNVLMQQKSDCWSDWIRHYTYGQTRDRVEFAAMRYRAIMRAGALPTDEAIMGAAPGELPAGAVVAAPAPTNAFAPPPQMVKESDAGPAPLIGPPEASAVPLLPAPPPLSALPMMDAGAPPAPEPPGAGCVGQCSDKWRTCRSTCSLTVCTACDRTYAKCAKGCWQ